MDWVEDGGGSARVVRVSVNSGVGSYDGQGLVMV